MPSTVYKGDLAEVTFGHESGMVITHGHFTNTTQWVSAHVANTDTTTITFDGGATGGIYVGANLLAYPEGLLAGCTLRMMQPTAGTGAFDLDDFAVTGNVYTITHNAGSVITVTPQMKFIGTSTDGDNIVIDALGCPALDSGMGGWHANPKESDESVLTDQFVGLAATITLPETKVEILRSHVVGIGRDVVVQVPQKLTNEGGSLETMMNSARWLYYCLGNEVIKTVSGHTAIATVSGGAGDSAAIAMGDNYVEFDGGMADAPIVNDFIVVTDNAAVLFPTDNYDPTVGTKWPASHTDFTQSERNEIRRVIAVDHTVVTARRIYVDDPFCFDHIADLVIYKITPANDNGTGSPNFDTAVGTHGDIDNRNSRLLFSGWHIPSFAIETSMRTRDIGSFNAHTDSPTDGAAAPGSANDSKQLTRIYKGCKVKDWSLSADADAEAKLSVNFDALMCYTDTGRLVTTAANKGDRYTAHRMFENTANGPLERKLAGIAPNTEKPFMFYNGSITAFGQTMAQVTKFNLTGNNNIVTHHTVRGSSGAERRNTAGDSLDQIPFSGSRNPALIVEGKNEYELSMEIIVDDPLLWHEFRTNRERNDSNPITLTMTKAGPGTDREQMIVIIDDYIIAEAPLQIPDDKGVIKSELKIKPKHVKVVSHDALLHC
jgi:hypothetical protein